MSTLENTFQRLSSRLETDPDNPHLYVQRGMLAFQRGDIAAAIADFDHAEHLRPTLTPYLWQRGLAYYYAKRFADGMRQFEVDLTVNDHDVEEAVWRYLCQAQLEGTLVARAGLVAAGPDPRPVMGDIYRLYAGQQTPESVLARYHSAGRRERFYSQLYVGLYYEAAQDSARARQHIVHAAEMRMVEDYMGWVALVHQRLRGWGHP